MRRRMTFTLLGAAVIASALVAQSNLQQALRDDVGAHWIYDEVSAATAKARAENKPILALLR